MNENLVCEYSKIEQKTLEYVSVIIPIYNESKYIIKCLESLEHQTFDKNQFEVLLIDGGSKDNTLELINNYKSELTIRVFFNEKKLVTYALNIGVNNSKGDYIVRMDAHAEYDKNYIEKSINCLKETGADNVGGIAETKGVGLIGTINSEILSSKFGVGNSQFRVGNKSGYVDTVPFGTFRKDIFDKVGLYNPKFPRSEDNDLNSRIRSNGGKIYLSTDIKFTYYCRNTLGGLLSQAIKNGNSLFLTLRSNPKAMSVRHFIPFLFLLSLIFMPILAIFVPLFKYVFCVEIILYLILDIFFSFFLETKRLCFLKILIYPLFHITYGIGSLIGLFGIKLY